ncbi:hypothetical protein [Sinisalibacter lacisalsi]|uniref:Pilus assembly protein n=1 Tax=Sinisalibacter lacisalsi TaxID=1526570 RepID=A0ABQ1QQ90_9RHOB|nr:hypothetical protein [Sinisalibacter lacisalsi]GGD35847.1 hypothetical protein GCM10011358_19590 [Sinisalibacter lacisalsi]
MSYPHFITCPAKFAEDEQGAVTVDWVVLTAAILLLGAASAFYVTSSVPEVADAIVNYLEGVEVVPE